MKKKKKTRFKKFKNTLVVISIFLITGVSIYAFAVEKTARAKEDELGELRTLIARYQSENQETNYKNTRGIVKTIEDICKEEDFDVDLAVRIAGCESYLNPYFVNVNRNGSIDRGIFAFNSKYYKEVSNECAFSAECSTRVFIQQVKAGKVNDWACYSKVK